MISLIYASTAKPAYSCDTVQDILNVSVPKNRELNVTGMLVYDGVFFVQCLEGKESAVMQLYETIRKDERHHSVKLIAVTPILSRSFEAWSMGYNNKARAIRDVTRIITGTADFIPYKMSYEQALELLKKLSFMI